MASTGGSQSSNLMQQSPHAFVLQTQSSAPAGFSLMQHSPLPSAPQMLSMSKDPNPISMCHVGQEVVHEIVNRAQDMFTLLTPKQTQLPNNQTYPYQQYSDKKMKVEEQMRQIKMNFQKLRVFYAKINENCDQIEMPPEQDLVPVAGIESEPTGLHSDMYLYASEQHREMVEQVRHKNQQLKEIIDSIRSIIWEINTMITMRKT